MAFSGKRKGESLFPSGAASDRRMTNFGKVLKPNSSWESHPVCRALWYTLGFAMERRIDWHKRELSAPAPTTNGWAAPSMIAIGQNEIFLFGRSVLMLPNEVLVRVEFSPTRDGGDTRVWPPQRLSLSLWTKHVAAMARGIVEQSWQ